MTIPATSAQTQATALQVLPYQNTQDDDNPSKNIKTLTIIRKTSEANQEHNPFSLLFNNSKTDQKVSVVDGKAIIEECSHSGMKLLGEGVFGAVSKGLLQYKNRPQREVAVKTIYSEYYHEEDFYDEVNAFQTVENQEHIVQFYFALHGGALDCNYHIIMECGDIDLEEYIDFIMRHPKISINEKQLAKMGYDTYSGTLACLKLNIFNLDIKPKNYIVFFESSTIKITDFGVLSSKKYLDYEILNTMIKQTANSFIQCALNKAYFDDQETQQKLQNIASNSANDLSVSDADKSYFKQQIPVYVNDNPLLLKLTQGIFGYNGNQSDIAKTLTIIKNEVGLQAPTDIRDML